MQIKKGAWYRTAPWLTIYYEKLDVIKKTAEEINLTKPKYNVNFFSSDISSENGINELVDEFINNEKYLDILINNSGVSWGAPLGNFP